MESSEEETEVGLSSKEKGTSSVSKVTSTMISPVNDTALGKFRSVVLVSRTMSRGFLRCGKKMSLMSSKYFVFKVRLLEILVLVLCFEDDERYVCHRRYG